MPQISDPGAEYRTRLERWRGVFRNAERQSVRLGNYRLAVAGVFAVLAYLAFVRDALSGWWVLTPIAAFVALIVIHERIARSQSFAKRGITYYERALLRVDGGWPGTGSSGDELLDPAHVYAGDLDVFGKGSLFELISTARTAAGERRLASWLSNPAPASEVHERQPAVVEMRDEVQLREDLALLGEDIRAGVHVDLLTAWGSAPPVHFITGARLIAAVLAASSIVTFVGFMAHWFGLRPFLIAAAMALSMGFALRHGVERVISSLDEPVHDLEILSLLLARLEKASFESPQLRRLRADLETEGLSASAAIARLGRWMELLDSSDHLVLRLIGPAVLWRAQAAMAIEAWRRGTGPQIGRWIAAIAELEAISSLASFAFEHPGATFPELLEGGPRFEATGLKHPLMGVGQAVANDVMLGDEMRLWIVSGSNMSGKSTLLRSIGLSAVLAWSGAPVTASRLRISRLAVGASIRIVDSLQDGKSRFYAEITRLRQIVALTEQSTPVLFLLDELLSGTNSHDRRIGAEAVIRTLVHRGAIGLVTTHDLALTRICEEFGSRAVNVHFEDHLEEGRMSFDYRLKPGVVERSNALELMRAVGLEV